MVASSRYMNFYGQRGARLTNDQTIYGYEPRRTRLIRFLSILFFYAPELHLRGTHDRHVLLRYTENPLNRAGIRLHGFHHLSTQVEGFHHEAAGRLGRIHSIRKYSPVLALQRDLRIQFR